MPGEFSAHLTRVVVPINVNFSNLFTAKPSDIFVAPFVIRSAAINICPTAIIDICAVKGIDDDGDVARALIDAAAAEVGIGTEIANINEGVVIGPDIAGAIDPRTDADAEFATGLGR